MKKSVLVDFYNLHLQSGWYEEDEIPFAFSTFTPPDENERQRIAEFFKIHAPNVVGNHLTRHD